MCAAGSARIHGQTVSMPLVGPNVKVNRHFAACRVWARILAQTWYAAKCPVGRWVRPRRHSEYDYRQEGYEVNYKFGT